MCNTYKLSFNILNSIEYLNKFVKVLDLDEVDTVKFLNTIVLSDDEESNVVDRVNDILEDNDINPTCKDLVMIGVSTNLLDIASKVIDLKRRYDRNNEYDIHRYRCVNKYGDSILILTKKDEEDHE